MIATSLDLFCHQISRCTKKWLKGFSFESVSVSLRSIAISFFFLEPYLNCPPFVQACTMNILLRALAHTGGYELTAYIKNRRRKIKIKYIASVTSLFSSFE